MLPTNRPHSGDSTNPRTNRLIPAAAAPAQGSDISLTWLIAKRTVHLMLDGENNTVYSPACILEGLKAMQLGAKGCTAKELNLLVGNISFKRDWLGLKGCPQRSYKDYVGRIVAGVWLDRAVSPEKGFEKACAREGIAVTEIDFSSPKASVEISRWISDATNGFITPTINPGPSSLSCIASALYIKDAWATPFSKWATERKPFHAPGADALADFMVDEVELEVSDNEFGTLVKLPLSNGASVVFLKLSDCLALSNIMQDDRIFDSVADFDADTIDVELHLPKFTCETTVNDMADILFSAGFSTAHHPDLSRMTGIPGTPAFFAHGCKIAVDERGLEAGAYFVDVPCTGVPDFDQEPPKPRVIVFDKPFLYAVVSRTNQPLFIGTVTQPQASVPMREATDLRL